MLRNNAHRYLVAAVAATAFAGFLTACSSDSADTQSSSSIASLPSSSVSSVAESSTTRVISSTAPPSVTPTLVPLDPVQLADMSDLTEISSLPYTGNAFGTHFSALDRTIGCKFLPAQGTCYVANPPQWRSDDWCALNRNDSVADSDLIGWGNGSYNQAPQHCARQGTSGVGPDYASGSAPFEYGTKMTILLSFEDDTSVTCGSRETGLTCVLEPSAAHGFHISSTDYLTW